MEKGKGRVGRQVGGKCPKVCRKVTLIVSVSKACIMTSIPTRTANITDYFHLDPPPHIASRIKAYTQTQFSFLSLSLLACMVCAAGAAAQAQH